MRWWFCAVLLVGCGPNAFYPDAAIDGDADGVLPQDGDCDDANPAVALGFEEVCDGVDNDCDGLTDGADETLWDDDGDGASDCEDCDDEDPTSFEDAEELCDGVDNDCDLELPIEEQDVDADGVRACEGDCDDEEAAASPVLVESCDGIDNDCDGYVDEPLPGGVTDQVGVAGPGGDLRAWDATNGLSSPTPLSIPVPSGFVGAMLVVDLDGDGSPEWVRQQLDPADEDADQVVALSRTCAGDWTEFGSLDVVLGGQNLLVAAGDLDGDGLGDLVSVLIDSLSAGAVFLHLGDGSGGFDLRTTSITLPSVAAGSFWTVAPHLRDVNLDGDVDLVTCEEEPSGFNCRLWTGDGDGGLGGGVVRVELSGVPGSVDLGDADADGLPDLFAGPMADGRVHLFRGVGSGQFAPGLPILAVGGSGWLRVVNTAPRASLVLLWATTGTGVDRALAVAVPERQFWDVGTEVTFPAVPAAQGLGDPLVAWP